MESSKAILTVKLPSSGEWLSFFKGIETKVWSWAILHLCVSGIGTILVKLFLPISLNLFGPTAGMDQAYKPQEQGIRSNNKLLN